MRVGTFNIVTDDKYLSYLAEENKAAELPRQPAGYARDTARELSSKAGGETVTFSLDPSRGALLSLLAHTSISSILHLLIQLLLVVTILINSLLLMLVPLKQVTDMRLYLQLQLL